MILKTTLTLASLSGLLLSLGAMPALAASGFTGVYDTENFTFSSSPSGAGNAVDDLDTTYAADGKVIISGPDDFNNNSGTNLAANNRWSIFINSSRAGTVSFDWSFSSFLNQVGDDSASYFVNSTFTTLATGNGGVQSSSSPVVLTLAEGDTFGFQVSTLTNTGGEGIFTITNFNATPVPLETDAIPIVVSAAFLGTGLWLKRRKKRS